MIVRRRSWDLPDRFATPEHLVFNRRAVLAGGTALALLPTAAMAQRVSDAAKLSDPTADLYPAKRNPKYTLDRPITDEQVNGHYNNFYEFGTSKDIADAAQALQTRPWTIKIDGMVEKPVEVGIDDFARPLGSAKYLRMETFLDPKMARGQRMRWFPWPYVEGLTLAEAKNELAFIATGAYGHPLAKQHGGPIRLVVPWKYGFKSIKSIVRFSFVEKQPLGMWQELQSSEYGFWANVNPAVPHPRWSQATEEVIGTGERRPTVIFNGYGEYVADLYKGLEGEKLYM